MKKFIPALMLLSVAGLVAAQPADAARKNNNLVAATQTIPDGTFGGSVTGTYTGDSKALSDTGGVLVKCYAPDRSGPLVFDAGFSIAADGTFVISPLAGWGTGWESGPADCDASAGYFPVTRGSWGEWVTLASTTFHVSG